MIQNKPPSSPQKIETKPITKPEEIKQTQKVQPSKPPVLPTTEKKNDLKQNNDISTKASSANKEIYKAPIKSEETLKEQPKGLVRNKSTDVDNKVEKAETAYE